jgi:hypothetical protein
MKNSQITIKYDGLSTEDKQYLRKIRSEIDKSLHDFSIQYDKCQCNKCRIMVLNQMEECIDAEIYKWIDATVVPEGQMDKVEDEALDHAINMVASLSEVVEQLNQLRKELLNS